MQSTFENTNAGDQITLDGTLCQVGVKGNGLIEVSPVNVGLIDSHTAESFNARDFQHLASREDPAPTKKSK